jgi:putative holliday junction resolvase
MMILSLDYGERYVGVAMTDPQEGVPIRHSVIDQKQEDVLKEVIKLVSSEHIEKVLVGVPLGLSGKETAQTHTSLGFIEQLRSIMGRDTEVEGVDERLSSQVARKQVELEGSKPNEEHAEAARLLLADYIKVTSPETGL